MKELNKKEIKNVAGGDVDACGIAVGALGVVGGANTAVAGYVATLAWGGPVGLAVGVAVGITYGGLATWAGASCSATGSSDTKFKGEIVKN
ncbi:MULTISPECIES: hypothetical protein [unclassified Pseudoalteromonas]|uniref:hypothetical protein n=1 Tax=unclassified Pseudoalteromonas TaxID=194690 RepID=UPI0005A85822|nr:MULTISPECIES: hypothetical protein [unclassified Pseudoalteromonas]